MDRKAAVRIIPPDLPDEKAGLQNPIRYLLLGIAGTAHAAARTGSAAGASALSFLPAADLANNNGEYHHHHN